MIRLILVFLLLTTTLLAFAADHYCPAYPAAQRRVDSDRLDLERRTRAFNAVRDKDQRPRPLSVASMNFIDGQIFSEMAAAGIESAPLSSDTEFLRRVTLDLTGRIPSIERVREFSASDNLYKRTELIESLMQSEEFVDYWTFLFANKFEVTSRYYNFIGVPGRNLFYNFLRDFVARDRSYAEVAGEMISTGGDTHVNGAGNFLIRGMQQGDPIQDTWDTITDRITTRFLGVKSECISCHNGARHLEEINLYLSERKREEFWRQSAFLSRMTLNQIPVDAFNQQSHFLIVDRSTGFYSAAGIDVNNAGPRPPRRGSYTPAYIFTGEEPKSGDWRVELARMVTSDRQFARATVNYIWAHFFKYGIVDPPDAWDLARIDPQNPPPAPWGIQASHPALLEMLADEFIRSNYSIRRIVRLIAESNAYQLSSQYPGEWRVEYERYFAKHFPRRLYAEEIYDAMSIATKTLTPMFIDGFSRPLMYAVQLPDSIEPSNDFRIGSFLSNFGRGDWFQTQRTSDTNVLKVLYLMNDNNVNFRTFGTRGVSTRVAELAQSDMSDAEAVTELFLATIGRPPNEDELQMLRRRRTGDYEPWLSDVQWSLLNKLEFIFNY